MASKKNKKSSAVEKKVAVNTEQEPLPERPFDPAVGAALVARQNFTALDLARHRATRASVVGLNHAEFEDYVRAIVADSQGAK